jgi:GNAT superfamily N-acetyltransferase
MNEIRLLTTADIPAAMRLNQAAGWNQIPADWERLLKLEPTGCFGLETDGHLAAATTAVCFGRRLAWIGMVLTDPEYRRRGYARRLMEHALEYLEERGIAWIKLDATEMGQPLYELLGFVAEESIERWSIVSPATAPANRTSSGFDLELYRELDAAAFGADRERVLRNLALGEAIGLPGGFAMGRPGAKALSFGPCIARETSAAKELAEWFLSAHPGDTIFWDLLPENHSAAELATELGFECRRKLVRMTRPGKPGAAPLLFDNSLVYATAGFEYG